MRIQVAANLVIPRCAGLGVRLHAGERGLGTSGNEGASGGGVRKTMFHRVHRELPGAGVGDGSQEGAGVGVGGIRHHGRAGSAFDNASLEENEDPVGEEPR